MTTTTPIPPLRTIQQWVAPPTPSRVDLAPPPLRERLDEVVTLLDVVPVAGPPVIFVLGPWAVFIMFLIGPFLLLATLALVAFILVAVSAAALAPAYLLVRHRRRHRTASATRQHISATAPTADAA
ncbi:MAG TPA: hypothetical protein VGG07_11440 [Solirubrobacteraceae bacterium]|jgi:hypothetical protein